MSQQHTKTMSKKELAAAYNICPATLNAWLKRANINFYKNIKIFNPSQLSEIFQKIGEP
jgi:hypothetical protein